MRADEGHISSQHGPGKVDGRFVWIAGHFWMAESADADERVVQSRHDETFGRQGRSLGAAES